MFPLNIQNEQIILKDIKRAELPCILKWYNKVDDFKFATGIDKPITLEVLSRKYAEVAICSSEFFAGVYTVKDEKMVGILKGRIGYGGEEAVWISSLVIDTGYQNKGYGSTTIDLVLGYLKKNNKIKCAYLSVVEDNQQGMEFWKKKNFKEMKRIENHLKLQNKQQNIIIMYRQV